MTTEKDLVEEVEALLASPDKYSDPFLAFRLLRRLKDEVKALRAHVADLNHDANAMVKEADAAEETMMRKLYGR